MNIIPVHQVSDDILLSSVFGGVICGAPSGIIFRFASSTGGFDVVGLIVAKYRDVSIGAIIFVFNLILLARGFIFGWDITLYTLISRFVVSKVIDAVHTKHIKLTIMTITEKGEEIKAHYYITAYAGDNGRRCHYTNHKKNDLHCRDSL